MRCDGCGEDNWIDYESDYSQFHGHNDVYIICLSCSKEYKVREWEMREFEQILIGEI